MKITREDKKKIEGPFNRALELREKGDFQGAIQILSGLSRSYPIAAIFGVIGPLYREIGDVNNAIKYSRKAVSLSPKSELASLNLFHSLLEAGHAGRAFSEMKRFLSVAKSKEYSRLLRRTKGDLEKYGRLLKNTKEELIKVNTANEEELLPTKTTKSKRKMI